MAEFIQVFITVNDEAKAKGIAATLLEKDLAACVQISGPVTSMYKWKGRVEEDQEWLMTVKSSGRLYEELEEQVKLIHDYEVPEIIAVPIERGSNDYLKWMKEELK